MTSSPRSQGRSPRAWAIVLAVPIVVVGFLLAAQDGILGPANHIGYAVCHQITVRTYIFGDLVLPLCARCTGQYLGAFVGMIMVASLGRWRAALLPPKWLVIVLFGFLAIWAFDGFNSYVYLILQRPLFYQPQNILRVSTGLLQGLALIFLFLPFFNRSFWAEPLQSPIIGGMKDLILALCLGLLVALAVSSRWLPLFYPLAIISAGTTFFFLSLVGTLFVLLVLRLENTNRTSRDFLALFIPGMAFAVLILLSANLVRFFAESRLGMVMPPG